MRSQTARKKAAPAGVVRSPVSRSTSDATLVGCWAASSKAIAPPRECPTTWARSTPRASSNPAASLACTATLVGAASSRAGAPTEPPPVVADALEALERRFRHERLERVGDVRAMDEQHWPRPTPDPLVRQLDAVDPGMFHDFSSVLSGPWRASR